MFLVYNITLCFLRSGGWFFHNQAKFWPVSEPVGFHSLTMLFSHLKAERPRPLTIIEFTTCFHEISEYEYTNFFTNISQLKKKTTFFQKIKTMVFCYQNCSDLLLEKIVLKALVVKNSVLHDFGFGKVSPAKQL